jgi:outer membrane scaffolding protein for murein synthesis (MipA/OmpV family)
MPRRVAAACVLLSSLFIGTAQAAEATDKVPADLAGSTPAPAPAPAQTRWEGAIGLTTSYRPEYSGSAKNIAKVTPAIFLRYGRFTITNASGFVTRRADDVVRGLGMDLTKGDRFRANLALRVDQGRGENSSDALTGLGDIKPTIRGRLNLSWRLDGPFRLGSSWSWDMLGKGGGYYGDLSAGLEHRFPASRNMVINSSVVLSAAGDRYMQTYYGVTEAQASRTRYPVYEARSGLRDVSWSLGFRTDLGEDWIFIAGAGMSRLLGPAAHSPLTGKRNNWGINAGAAWRF